MMALCAPRSEEHTSELQSPCNLVCRLLLEKKYAETRAVGGGAIVEIDLVGRSKNVRGYTARQGDGIVGVEHDRPILAAQPVAAQVDGMHGITSRAGPTRYGAAESHWQPGVKLVGVLVSAIVVEVHRQYRIRMKGGRCANH